MKTRFDDTPFAGYEAKARSQALLRAAAPDLLRAGCELAEALSHEQCCAACAEDGCSTCGDCNALVSLAAFRKLVEVKDG